jgi:hypothetical protein
VNLALYWPHPQAHPCLNSTPIINRNRKQLTRHSKGKAVGRRKRLDSFHPMTCIKLEEEKYKKKKYEV